MQVKISIKMSLSYRALSLVEDGSIWFCIVRNSLINSLITNKLDTSNTGGGHNTHLQMLFDHVHLDCRDLEASNSTAASCIGISCIS